MNSPEGQSAQTQPNPVPRATYRLQFNRDFTFADATRLVPYLDELGISHIYASPFLKARAGSGHGYDIVDHSALNPEIGDEAALQRLTDALYQHGMGQILDLVPNHMGVFGDDNGWWLDVLENGPASLYAGFFDIDWQPLKEQLRGKILVPVLGDHYGAVLEAGELKLVFDERYGEFSVRYYGHRFPIDPATYPVILQDGQEGLADELGSDSARLLAFQSLITAFGHLPSRGDLSEEKMDERRRDKEIHKRHLAALCQEQAAIGDFVRASVERFNGEPGRPESFNRLAALLERQAYRLASWLVASDEINYRRFFDINDLAGLRTEEPQVFQATHELVLKLMAQGRLQGLRIDHPDGLYDPLGYYERLVQAVSAAGEGATDDAALPCYLVVEKILAPYEYLPEEWPVHGTTGYEFANLVNGLFVCGEREQEFNRLYARFIGRRIDFDDLLYERKRLIIDVQLSSELTVLASLLDALAQTNRHTRDFTLNGCRGAIKVLTACFPVYRTYITPAEVSEQDRRYVEWAVAQAKKRSPAADISIFDFIRDILLHGAQLPDPIRRLQATRFTMKFQQYTAPVMAKAMEDTAFYIYNRLVSLNEVGGDPRRFGYSAAAFHRANQERIRRWPHALLATSTHDSKRSEDVRARIDILSERPEQWQKHTSRWSRVNRAKKTLVDGAPAPSRNDEYLLYQTLFGTWPLEEIDEAGLETYRTRIKDYMTKAVKEAKVHTSWINPNTAYEEAIAQLIDTILSGGANPFLTDFVPFQRGAARFGLLNSLSQTLLKLTAPGVPDFYQGSELWQFNLVDPDNRRVVDYEYRRWALQSVKEGASNTANLRRFTRTLVETLEDGRAKLYLIWRTLNMRRRLPHLFATGEYLPLTTEGERADYLCAFCRRDAAATAVTIVPRRFVDLMGGDPHGKLDFGPDTYVELPSDGPKRFRNLFTGEQISHDAPNDRLPASGLFHDFPVALLVDPPSYPSQ